MWSSRRSLAISQAHRFLAGELAKTSISQQRAATYVSFRISYRALDVRTHVPSADSFRRSMAPRNVSKTQALQAVDGDDIESAQESLDPKAISKDMEKNVRRARIEREIYRMLGLSY